MLQEEYHAKGKKLCICFVNLEKDFDRVLSVGIGNYGRKEFHKFWLDQ